MVDVSQNGHSESSDHIRCAWSHRLSVIKILTPLDGFDNDNELVILGANDGSTKVTVHKRLLHANSEYCARIADDYYPMHAGVCTVVTLNAYLNWIYRRALPQAEQNLASSTNESQDIIDLAGLYCTAAFFEDKVCQDTVVDAMIKLAKRSSPSARNNLPRKETIELVYVAQWELDGDVCKVIAAILAIYADLAEPAAVREIAHGQFLSDLAYLLLGRARMGETGPLLADACMFHVHDEGECRSKKGKKDE